MAAQPEKVLLEVFARRLSEIEQRSGTARTAFAIALGISNQQYRVTLKGEANPTFGQIEMIADRLRISVWALIGEAEPGESVIQRAADAARAIAPEIKTHRVAPRLRGPMARERASASC